MLLYLPALRFGFVWDDHRLIETTLDHVTTAQLPRLLTSDFWASIGEQSGFWRPLVTASFWLDGRFSHWNPAWFHAVNILANAAAAAALVLFLVEWRVPPGAALLAGLWFTTQPAAVESVAWISGRTDVLCALWFRVALWLDRRARHAGRRGPGVLAVGALALGLLSKETAVLFLPVVALAEWIDRPTAPGAAVPMGRWLAPYAAVTAAYLVAHGVLVPPPPVASYLDPAAVARTRWAAWTTLPNYLRFLSPDASVHAPGLALPLPHTPWTPAVVAGVAMQFALAAAVAFLALRRRRLALPIAVVWLTLLPVTLGMVIRADVLFAERFLYLPSFGVATAMALGIAALRPVPEAQRMVGALVAALVLAGALATVQLLPTWSDDLALFRTMKERSPRSVKAQLGWADVMLGAGRDDAALQALAAAERIDPRLPQVSVGRAMIAFRHGRWPQALAAANQALALDSLDLDARLLATQALLRLGRVSEAHAALAPMVALRSGHPSVDATLGEVLLAEGDAGAALPKLEHAERWIRDDADLERSLGLALARAGRAAEARDALGRALTLDPSSVEGWLGYAAACHVAGDLAARDDALERAAALPGARDGRLASLRAMFARGPEPARSVPTTR